MINLDQDQRNARMRNEILMKAHMFFMRVEENSD